VYVRRSLDANVPSHAREEKERMVYARRDLDAESFLLTNVILGI